MTIKEKLIRNVYQDGQHEFLVTVDFAKLDPAIFIKAMRSAQHRAIIGHGAVAIQYLGRFGNQKFSIKKRSAP